LAIQNHQPKLSPDPRTELASSIVPDFQTLHPSYGINRPPSALMQPTPDYVNNYGLNLLPSVFVTQQQPHPDYEGM
jgi:hypothetical protein